MARLLGADGGGKMRRGRVARVAWRGAFGERQGSGIHARRLIVGARERAGVRHWPANLNDPAWRAKRPGGVASLCREVQAPKFSSGADTRPWPGDSTPWPPPPNRAQCSSNSEAFTEQTLDDAHFPFVTRRYFPWIWLLAARLWDRRLAFVVPDRDSRGIADRRRGRSLRDIARRGSRHRLHADAGGATRRRAATRRSSRRRAAITAWSFSTPWPGRWSGAAWP